VQIEIREHEPVTEVVNARVMPAVPDPLLLRVSGVHLLEADLLKQKPAYRDYMERTSAFLPMPPRRGRPRCSGEGCR